MAEEDHEPSSGGCPLKNWGEPKSRKTLREEEAVEVEDVSTSTASSSRSSAADDPLGTAGSSSSRVIAPSAPASGGEQPLAATASPPTSPPPSSCFSTNPKVLLREDHEAANYNDQDGNYCLLRFNHFREVTPVIRARIHSEIGPAETRKIKKLIKELRSAGERAGAKSAVQGDILDFCRFFGSAESGCMRFLKVCNWDVKEAFGRIQKATQWRLYKITEEFLVYGPRKGSVGDAGRSGAVGKGGHEVVKLKAENSEQEQLRDLYRCKREFSPELLNTDLHLGLLTPPPRASCDRATGSSKGGATSSSASLTGGTTSTAASTTSTSTSGTTSTGNKSVFPEIEVKRLSTTSTSKRKVRDVLMDMRRRGLMPCRGSYEATPHPLDYTKRNQQFIARLESLEKKEIKELTPPLSPGESSTDASTKSASSAVVEENNSAGAAREVEQVELLVLSGGISAGSPEKNISPPSTAPGHDNASTSARISATTGPRTSGTTRTPQPLLRQERDHSGDGASTTLAHPRLLLPEPGLATMPPLMPSSTCSTSRAAGAPPPAGRGAEVVGVLARPTPTTSTTTTTSASRSPPSSRSSSSLPLRAFDGSPIEVWSYQSLDLTKLFRSFSEKELEYAYINYCVRKEQACRLCRAQSVLSIVDVKGLSLTYLLFQMGKLKVLTKWMEQYGKEFFPDSMTKVFVVNSPPGAEWVWKMFKNSTSEVVQSKVFILGGDGRKEISEFLDYDRAMGELRPPPV